MRGKFLVTMYMIDIGGVTLHEHGMYGTQTMDSREMLDVLHSKEQGTNEVVQSTTGTCRRLSRSQTQSM